ncbi:helicase HerA domain-containing protein [Parvibaculum sp.]|uniref:helicase HerA domain-containing protein n=1 Tax=Parvibaculum sp. TaxID=2024848 RepID=UPI00391B9DE5
MQRDAEIIAIYGRRGSGKSTLAKGMIAKREKVVIFDPRAEYGARGRPAFDRLADVGKHISKNFRRGFQCAYVPPAGQEPEALHELVSRLWLTQWPYDCGEDTRKLTLLIEEMDLSYPVRALPSHLNGMARAVNQGRHVGLELIGVTQRPAQISATFRANCAATIIFPLAADNDRQEVLRLIGRGHADALRSLEKFHCLICRDAQVTPAKIDRRGQISAKSI